MKRKHHKVAGMGDDLMPAVLVTGGVVASDFIKGMLPASLATSMGANYPLIVNGLGIAAGLFIPGMIKDAKTKEWVQPVMVGIAAQCAYSLYVSKVKGASPPVINRTWATYALAGGKSATYALGCVTNPDGTKTYVPVTNNMPQGTMRTPSQQVNPTATQVQPTNNTQPAMQPIVTKATPMSAKTTSVGRKGVIGGF